MKYVSEFREHNEVKKWIGVLHEICRGSWRVMEVCGGQTHSILKNGIDALLPDGLELIHGPGCPVCVTPLEKIEKALMIAQASDTIFCSFGDMLRVPGKNEDLLTIKARGHDIRVVYSPMECLKIAQDHPEKRVVFFAVGFETTAPANAMTVFEAKRLGIKNFSVLVSHVLVPPAIESVMNSKTSKVNGFLAAGHVCTIMGLFEYEALVKKYQVPIVATGFEPLDILQGLVRVVSQLEKKEARVENQYSRSVLARGNDAARKRVESVFEVAPQSWRGLGEIAKSGLRLRSEFREFDAEVQFDVDAAFVKEPAECITGQVLTGIKKPPQCQAFGKACTPEHPLGATMVSSEGACAAYFKYRRTGK